MPPSIRRPIATNSRVKQDEIFKRDLYLSFVANALQQKSNGSSDSFDELVGQFSTNTNASNTLLDANQIRLWIVALSHVVSRLERTHASLVHAIINMPWTTLDNATVKSYIVFMGMLLSARPEYLSFVLAKIAQSFTYRLQALDKSLPESSMAPVTRRLIYDRLHDLLQHILFLIPTLPSSLQAFLIRNFPHKRQNQVAQTTYIRNLLKVSSYCPELADKILATIVNRAIQIDVEIQIELDELDEDENVEDHDIFELDPLDVVVGQPGDSILSNHEDSDKDSDDGDNFSDLSSEFGDIDGHSVHLEVPMNIKHIQDMVNKLDAILTLVFEHFQRTYEAVLASTSSVNSRPLSPLELLPLPPVSPSTPSLSNPHTPSVSFGPSLAQLTSTFPAASISTPQSEQTTWAPVPHTEQYLRVQFQALLSIFDRIILRTFKSRYTQFLIFWYTSLDPEFADVFQGMLVDRALLGGTDPHHYGGIEDGDKPATANMITPELTRAAAASYIGSFVSRATFVDREGARRVVGVLCEFLNAHLESAEQVLRAGWGTLGVDRAVSAQEQHTVFYAVTQAVLLIFCFRWRDLVDDDDTEDDDDGPRLYLDSNGMVAGKTKKSSRSNKDKWMPELGILKRVVVSVLNPLKVCSTTVVMQFARVAYATDFLYCYTILETNKRGEHGSITSRSRVAHTTSPRHQQSDASTITMTTQINNPVFILPINAELNTFFPFDPYRLPKSHAFIQGVYREWSSVAIEDEEEEEEEEEEELDRKERNEEGDDKNSRRLDIPRNKENDGGLGESLGAMSISPLTGCRDA